MSEVGQPDSTAVRWAARLVYCAMAPFVLVGGLLVDIHGSMVRVARIVCGEFGWDDPALPEVVVGLPYFTFLGVTGFVFCHYALCALKAFV